MPGGFLLHRSSIGDKLAGFPEPVDFDPIWFHLVTVFGTKLYFTVVMITDTPSWSVESTPLF
jgi:hypothetical protein